MYSLIQKAFSSNDFIKSLGDNVVIKKNETGNRFVSLTQKKCLVIRLDKPYRYECGVSSSADNENFLTPDKINGKFLIMEGLQYQSQHCSNTLFYIEL